MTNWKDWCGLPVLPVEGASIVDVRLRSGKVLLSVTAKDLLWGRAKREAAANDNYQNGGEIVAYRLAGEEA